VSASPPPTPPFFCFPLSLFLSHLRRQQLDVAPRRQGDNFKLVGVLGRDVQGLGADGAGGAEDGEALGREGGLVFERETMGQRGGGGRGHKKS
jgi:hypothetical protein